MTSPEECAVRVKESRGVGRRKRRPGGPMVSVSASHRKGSEICPQPVYKRHCSEIFRLKIPGSPRVHWGRARKICGVQSPDGACTEENLMQRLLTVFILKISVYFTGENCNLPYLIRKFSVFLRFYYGN